MLVHEGLSQCLLLITHVWEQDTKSYSDSQSKLVTKESCGNTYDTVASLLHEATKQKGEENDYKN